VRCHDDNKPTTQHNRQTTHTYNLFVERASDEALPGGSAAPLERPAMLFPRQAHALDVAPGEDQIAVGERARRLPQRIDHGVGIARVGAPRCSSVHLRKTHYDAGAVVDFVREGAGGVERGGAGGVATDLIDQRKPRGCTHGEAGSIMFVGSIEYVLLRGRLVGSIDFVLLRDKLQLRPEHQRSVSPLAVEERAVVADGPDQQRLT
jgi:hypothetical protein